MLSLEKSVHCQASEVLHFLVDGSQQLLEDSFEFVFGCIDHLDAEIADSIIDAARRHLKVSTRAREWLTSLLHQILDLYDTVHTVGQGGQLHLLGKATY